MKFFRTFLAALLAVVVGSFMMGFLWILALVGIAGTMESTTAVQPESVLVINLDEDISDSPVTNPFNNIDFNTMSTVRHMSLYSALRAIDAAAGDSRIRFFNSAWRELPASKYIELPTRDDFFLFPDSLSKVQREELMRPVDICLIEYTFEPDGSICARQSWEEYLDRETYNRLKPYLRESITLRWNGKNFKE